MSSGTPKDHFVPQFYLDPFAIEGSGSKTPHIYQYMLDAVIPARISDIASKKHFYTFTNKNTGNPDRTIDEFLTNIETDADKPLKKILETNTLDLNTDEFSALARFIALLVVRTPGFIKSQESMEEAGIKELYALDTMSIEKLNERFLEAGITLTREQLQEQMRIIHEKDYDIEFEDSRPYFLARGIKIALEEFAEWYFNKHWHLLINDGTTLFITSDNPVSIFRPIHVKEFQNAGYGNGTIFLPISPNCGILLRDLPLKKSVIKVNDDLVVRFNKNTMAFSDNYIYSNLNSKRIHNTYLNVGNKKFQKINTIRHKFAPYIFFQSNPVPEELIF